MLTVSDALERFQRTPSISRVGHPFRLVSSISPPASLDEIERSWPTRKVPEEVSGLWRASRAARLFEDLDYGQWGLALLDPQASKERTEAERTSRPQEFRPDDVIIGEFLGDQELLVFAPSEVSVRRVLIALPLDPRSEWFGAAADLVQFLDGYFRAGGNKYWEHGGT